MNTNPRILAVDDEEDILVFLKYNLEKEGFEVKTTTDSTSVVSLAESFEPDLVLLDLMMPGVDGIELCVDLRKSPRLKDLLVVFLTARGEDYSQVAGFDAGADDYIVKPIKPRLLTSKLQAILRRRGSGESVEEKNDLPLSVDHESFTVKLNDDTFELPKKEFKLLALLLSKPGKVFTRDEILERVWGTDTYVGDRTIDVHIRKIREKIGSEYIRTIKGVGYKLELL